MSKVVLPLLVPQRHGLRTGTGGGTGTDVWCLAATSTDGGHCGAGFDCGCGPALDPVHRRADHGQGRTTAEPAVTKTRAGTGTAVAGRRGSWTGAATVGPGSHGGDLAVRATACVETPAACGGATAVTATACYLLELSARLQGALLQHGLR